MRYAAWLILSVLTLSAVPATAQDVRVLQDRLQRLESELVQLQRQVYRGGVSSPPSGSIAPAPVTGGGGDSSAFGILLTRVDQLEEQLRGITGRLEQSENRNQQLQRRLDKLVEDMDFRFAQLEKRGPADPAAPGAPVPLAPVPLAPGQSGQVAPPPANAGPGAPPTTLGTIPATALDPNRVAAATPPAAAAAGKLPPGTPQERYNHAVKLLQQGDYAEAEAAFTEFTTAHPNDPLSANAQYWVGETWFARNQFDRSAKAFLAGYQKYPKSAKAPDNLLKLSMSLTNLNQKQEACAVLKQLSTEFPNADAQNKQAAARERTRAGCK